MFYGAGSVATQGKYCSEVEWEVAEERAQTGKSVPKSTPQRTLQDRIAKNIRAMARHILPEVAIQEVVRYRSYEPAERPAYLKLRLMNGARLANPKRARPPDTARTLLFVCFGNIMRSPMCEALMNRVSTALANQQISAISAGLNATPGRPAHPWAIAAAGELDISLEHHRARLLSPEMVDKADAIFAMDHQNLVQLMSRYPRAKNRIFMLSAFADEDYGSVEIRDPYYEGREGTRNCYAILDTCIRNLAASLHQPCK